VKLHHAPGRKPVLFEYSRLLGGRSNWSIGWEEQPKGAVARPPAAEVPPARFEETKAAPAPVKATVPGQSQVVFGSDATDYTKKALAPITTSTLITVVP
jgi:hypothetical protein